MRSYSTIYSVLISGKKKETASFVFLALILSSLQAPLPYLSGYLIDRVLPSGHPALLIQVTLTMALLYAGYLVLAYVNGRLLLSVRQEILTDLNHSAMRGILSMSLNRRSSIHSGDLISRLTRDTEQLNSIMPYGLSNAVRHSILAAALLAVVFILNWKLSSLLVPLVPIAVIIYLRFDKALWDSSKAETKASATKLARIQETIHADAEIKAYEAEQFFLEHSGEGVRNFEKKRFLRELYDTKVGILIMGAPMLAIVLIWYVGGRLVMADEITLGLIITYTTTLAMIVPSLVSIIEFISSLPNEKTALKRIVQLFPQEDRTDSTSASSSNKSLHENTHFVEKIEICDTTFSYSADYPLFKSLDLSFSRGNAYLINGGNGSGKSTLLNILSGALTPQSGSVQLDGRDTGEIPIISNWITYVPQRVSLISDSIHNNVTFGADYSNKQVKRVLDLVGLGDWIESLEDGTDHVISNANSELSGGQVQKIGLARALLRSTPVLLMDEPTNNLDSQAVMYLLDIIRSHKAERIIVIVSHDDRVFDAVDHVIYLENSSTSESTKIIEKPVSSSQAFVDKPQ